MFPLRSGARSFWERQKIQLFSYLLIITEIAGMHDPENKAESWETPLEASPSSVLLSIVCLPSWMPPTPGMSEVEAVAPSPEERSLGTLTLVQQAKLLRLGKKVKIVSDWKHCSLWALIHTSTVNWLKTEQKQCGGQTIRWLQSSRAKVSAAFQLHCYPNCWAIKHWSKNLSYVCCSLKHSVFLYQEVVHIIAKCTLMWFQQCWNHIRVFLICHSVNSHTRLNKRSVIASKSQHPCKLKDVSKVEGMWSEWSSSTVTFQLDIHNFHLPKPRSPVEQLPNRVISAVVSPDSRSRAREGARGGLLALQWLLCGLTFRAGWSMGLGRLCPCSGSSRGEGPGSFPLTYSIIKLRSQDVGLM